MVGRYDELEELMDRYGISRANVFCLDEPDREPGFRAPNDRTLAFAERSNGRLIPYVRLDLTESPIEEATRCLDLGARGIKLHPRAQKFLLNDERLAPVFELDSRSEEHTSELQSRLHLVCRLLLEKKKKTMPTYTTSTSCSTGMI